MLFKRNKTVYYCDMDGVLANFNIEPNAVERFASEKGFFKNLKPIQANLKGIKKLIEKGENVKILTTSPHTTADFDKITWLKKYLPELKPTNVIFARPEKSKISYISRRKRKHAILFDDYGKNVKEWVANGGSYAFKISNKMKKENNPMYTTLRNIKELTNKIY